PCSAPWAAKDGYVVDVTPWATAAGLRRGDRLVAFGGKALTGIKEADLEAWARVEHSQNIAVRVDRAGEEITLQLPCRDDRQRWEALDAVARAVADGRWQDCVDALSLLAKIDGFASSVNQFTALRCISEKSKSERQRPPDEHWRRMHAWANKT